MKYCGIMCQYFTRKHHMTTDPPPANTTHGYAHFLWGNFLGKLIVKCFYGLIVCVLVILICLHNEGAALGYYTCYKSDWLYIVSVYHYSPSLTLPTAHSNMPLIRAGHYTWGIVCVHLCVCACMRVSVSVCSLHYVHCVNLLWSDSIVHTILSTHILFI